MRDTYVSLANNTQQQTDIPYILIDGRFEATPAALRLLGNVLGLPSAARSWRGMSRRHSPRSMPLLPAPFAQRPRVYLARGPDGLETGVVGSINTEIIERAGARNVADAPGQRGSSAFRSSR